MGLFHRLISIFHNEQKEEVSYEREQDPEEPRCYSPDPEDTAFHEPESDSQHTSTFKITMEGRTPEPPGPVYVIGEGTIPEEEKKYYRPEEYYKNYAYDGLGKEVITFEAQKKNLVPTRNGLYPAEVLLLHYCTFGTYPHPRNGFPGFWWYEYGIRDVVGALGSLEVRGFLRRSNAYESIERYTVAELKNILKEFGLPVSGKKAELISRVKERINFEDLNKTVDEWFYVPTPLGQEELEENQNVPYMHSYPQKTTNSGMLGPAIKK